MSNPPTVTDWISAISTAALGVLGAFITVWQWTKTGFRPRITARIDSRSEAIELRVVNAGRAGGIVDQVEVLMPKGDIREDVRIEGFTDGRFRPLALPGLASMRLILESPQDAPFASGVRVLVNLGQARPKLVDPVVTPPHVGLVGLKSVLPPGASLWGDWENRGRGAVS
jgi:hypothetical protein